MGIFAFEREWTETPDARQNARNAGIERKFARDYKSPAQPGATDTLPGMASRRRSPQRLSRAVRTSAGISRGDSPARAVRPRFAWHAKLSPGKIRRRAALHGNSRWPNDAADFHRERFADKVDGP